MAAPVTLLEMTPAAEPSAEAIRRNRLEKIRLGQVDLERFALAGTVFYRDGFHERLNSGPMFPGNKKEHWVHQTFFFDGQASYDFSFAAPVETKPVAGYSKGTAETELGKDGKPIASAAEQTASYGLPAWKRILSGTAETIG